MAAAAVLERGAELLTLIGGNDDELQAAMSDLSAALTKLEDHAAAELPGGPADGRRRAGIRTVSAAAAVSRRPRQHARQRARPGLPCPGGRLRGHPDRADHRADSGGRAPQLAAAHARPSAGGPARIAVRRRGQGSRARPAAFGVAAQQHPRRGRAGTGCAGGQAHRGAALVLGRARRAVGAAVQRAQYRAGLAPSARRDRRGLLVGAAILQGIGTNEMALWILLPFASC